MCRFSKIISSVLTALLMGPIAAPVFANDSVDAWRQLDEDFRQAIVEEISARRGLDPNDQNPDWLIQSAEDIEEALRVSCELSGACGDESGRATLGEYLISFPDYDEQQGLLNAEMIRRMKSDHEN